MTLQQLTDARTDLRVMSGYGINPTYLTGLLDGVLSHLIFKEEPDNAKKLSARI